MEIHPDFFDPIKIQLEGIFQEKIIVNKLLSVIRLSITVHTRFKFIFIHLTIFLLIMFDLYIHINFFESIVALEV